MVPDPHARDDEPIGGLDPHAALVAAMAEHDERLRALAYHLLGSRDAMDDVLQEVYLKAHRRLTGFRGDSSLSTWLYRITYTTCVDRLSRGRRTRPAPVEEIEESLPRVTAEDDARACCATSSAGRSRSCRRNAARPCCWSCVTATPTPKPRRSWAYPRARSPAGWPTHAGN